MTDVEVCSATEVHIEGISAVVLDALRTTNARDYPSDVIESVAQNFSPRHIRTLLGNRDVVVALIGARVVGTASLDGDVVRTVFVAPDGQGKGVGRSLMQELERRARSKGMEKLSVPSSITAEPFYAKLGFARVRDVYHGAEVTILMERHL
jgi:GNAT superfamily N-acetyltransferase